VATKRTKPRIQIPTGTVLTHRRRDGATVKATVTEGGVRMGGKDYRSLNAAAMAAGGGKPVDAWRYWRLEDGQVLDVLRRFPESPRPARVPSSNGKEIRKRNARRVGRTKK